MLILYFLFIPIIYVFLKLFLYFLAYKFGKLSYKDFSILGFEYDDKKDVFVTSLNAWQKNFGYCHLYDVMAPIFRMIIDTEEVKFYYNNKYWLVAFWKGQYGITTGCEVGIYSTSQKYIDKNTLYMASEKDLFDISIVLYKNKKLVEIISDKHWWLGMFKIGMFSKPKELTMDINIIFPNKDMLYAFLKSFKKLGYKKKDYIINNNSFSFRYTKPKTKKVWSRSFILDKIRQHYNKKNVILYNKYLSDVIDDNTSYNNSIIKLQDLVPDILKNNSNNKNNVKTFSTSRSNVVLFNSNINSIKHNSNYG